MKNLFDAFISYGRADSKAFATKLHERLTSLGLKVWFDKNDIPLAVDFQNQIDDGIEKTHNFIFIIAPHSVKSPYCLKEIELAVKYNKRIVPVLHVNSDAFLDQMHPRLRKLNWLFFQEGINDFETSFASLISLLGKHADYVEQHTKFLVKALDWSRNHKQNNYLLIGEERKQAESWLKVRFKDEQPPCEPTDLHCEFISESTKNANNLMTQVFICYETQDKNVMEKVGKTLRRSGLTIWTNKTDIKTGTEFQEEINKGIERADNLVYLISQASLKSKYCQQELAHALANNKRIVPLLIEATDVEQISPQLRTLQFIEFTEYEDEEKSRTSADKLLNVLNQDAYYYEQHKILLVKALKWQRQNGNQSILLRGYNLQHAEAWLKVALSRNQHLPLPLQVEYIRESSRQPTELSLEIFISYSRTDSDFARQLNEALQLQGKTTWFDQESIASGTDFGQEINRGIEQSDNFLFIISPSSVNSPYCADEVEYAQKLNKRFVTVLHAQVPADELHPDLARIQWIDFNRHGGDFYANFSELVRTLDTDREHVQSHTKWLGRGREWEQKGKSADLLLRGSEFSLAQHWLQEAEKNNKQPPATDLQKTFITESGEAIAAEIKREKRRIFTLRLLLGLMSIAFVAAVCFGGVAIRAKNRVERLMKKQINTLSLFSESLEDSNREFDALLVALKAGKSVQTIQLKEKSQTRSRVVAVLLKAIENVKEHNRLSKHKPVYSVSFSPDGQTIATASDDGTVKLWTKNGQELKTFQAHDGRVWSVSFSPDGKTIATASQDRTAKLWSLDGQELKTLTRDRGEVTSVSFSPDGKTIATGNGDGTVTLWSQDSEESKTLNGHKGGVWSVSFSPDGNTIATADQKGTVKLWNRDGEELQTWKGHENWVWSVSFSPDGRTIATTSSDKTVKLWSLDGKELQTLKGHEKSVLDVSFSPDGKTIATASSDKTVKLWSLDGKELQTLKGHENWVWSVSFSPNDQTIASASKDATVRLWSWSRDSQELQTLQGHKDEVYSVSFSPSGQTLATASADKTAKLWSQDGRELQILQGHKDKVLDVSFSPDGQIIATASADKTAKLWSQDGRELQTFQGHGGEVHSVSFSPDGQTIATASGDQTAKLWRLDSQLLQTLRHNGILRSVSFTPDGQTIATASGNGTVKLWSREGQVLQTLNRHKDSVLDVSFSPDGQTLATASSDKTVKLWSLDGQELQTLTGHEGLVYGVSFSPDGKIIATASDDKTVKLWSQDGRELQTLTGHKDSALGVSFSPDGHILATASSDKSVILWNLDLEKLASLRNLDLDDLMERGCDWVRDYLKYNSEVEKGDRTLCDGIGTGK
ncbi:MAG: toll/interleukin-1 receptor domain-containing protein [Xenococcaceae cyanobacterium]